MSSALFTSVTGLQVHQSSLDVIANNIANANTTGYRSSGTQFQDLFSQNLVGSSAPTATSGGRNAIQVGLGATIASIDTDFSQGSLTTTGVDTDLAIQGSGFFILSDGSTYTYTRDGSFDINANGQLIESSTGQFVQGYLADSDGNIDTNSGVQNLEIPIGGSSIVQATSEAVYEGNLDASAAVGTTVERTVRIYDSLGEAHDLALIFTKTSNSNEWSWEFDASSDPGISSVTPDSGSVGTLTFDSTGRLTASTPSDVTVAFVAGGSSTPDSPLTFTLDFSEVTQLSGESDAALTSQNGFAMGVLESFDLGSDGVITGVFSNGLTRVIGQVALATFPSETGLVRIGNNQFRESPASGLPQIGTPNSGGRGLVSGGVLESSNVDLTEEFSNLILVQRGYQANARSVTAADTLLQETVNLIR